MPRFIPKAPPEPVYAALASKDITIPKGHYVILSGNSIRILGAEEFRRRYTEEEGEAQAQPLRAPPEKRVQRRPRRTLFRRGKLDGIPTSIVRTVWLFAEYCVAHNALETGVRPHVVEKANPTVSLSPRLKGCYKLELLLQYEDAEGTVRVKPSRAGLELFHKYSRAQIMQEV